MSQTELAPIKINLFLHVVGRRDNGYHDLQSLFVFGDMGDRITWLDSRVDTLRLSVDGPFAAEVPLDDSNLVLRAARLLNPSACGHLHLNKTVPVASGLGGGSADAAATLRLLNRVWALGYDLAGLATLAEPLGADVPACVYSQPCYVSGVGEKIALTELKSSIPCIVINPLIGLSTQAVFQAHAIRSQHFSSPLLPWPPHSVALSSTINDLERDARAIVPAIDHILTDLEQQPGCMLARMSGSGASCFGFFETPELAAIAYTALCKQNPVYWIILSNFLTSHVIL